MIYPLNRFQSIPKKDVLIFESIGITNTDELLSRAALPDQRIKLANETGISEDNILKWSAISDLVRVKGIGQKLAVALVLDAEVMSGAEFIGSIWIGDFMRDYQKIKSGVFASEIDSNATELLNLLRKKTNLHISKKQLLEAFYEALELNQRLVNNQPNKTNFSDVIRNEMRITMKSSLKLFAQLTLLILLLGILIAIFFYFLMQKNFYQINTLINYYYDLQIDIESIFTTLVVKEVLLITILVCLSVYTFIAVYTVFSAYSDLFLNKLLFNNRQLKTSYVAFNFKNQLKELQRKSKSILIVVALLFAIFIIIMINSLGNFSTSQTKIPLIILGNVLVILIFTPQIRLILRKSLSSLADVMVLRRVIVINIINIFINGAFIFLFISIVIPATLNGFLYISENYTRTEFNKSIDLAVLEFNNQNLKDNSNQPLVHEEMSKLVFDYRDKLNSELHEGLQDYSLNSTKQTELSDIMEILFWLILPATILLVYFPYFKLNKPLRGIIILIVIGLSFIIENVLQKNIGKWYGLQFNELKSTILIWVIVFANVILFDWVISLVSERTKTCPNCQSIIDHKHLFCHECGFVQQQKINP